MTTAMNSKLSLKVIKEQTIVVLIGDASVGKAFLLNRYIKDNLPKHQGPTIGVEFAAKVVELKNNTYVKAQIWDTAGQEKYRAMTTAYYSIEFIDITENPLEN